MSKADAGTRRLTAPWETRRRGWDGPESDPEIRILGQAVDGGGDPRKPLRGGAAVKGAGRGELPPWELWGPVYSVCFYVIPPKERGNPALAPSSHPSLAEGPSLGISSPLRQSGKTSAGGWDTSYFVHLRRGGEKRGPLSYH